MTFFGVGSAASAALVVPVVLRLGTPSGGPFSTIMLSWLHVLVSAGLAVAALAWALSQARWPARSAAGRVARLAAAGLAAAAVVLAVPSVRTPLLIGLRFMTMSDSVGAVTYEQLPLFALFGRAPVVAAQYYFGWLAYVLPVAPIAALLAACDARRRAPACVLAAWSAPLAVLSILQTRYGNDFGPAAAVCFALAFERLARLLATRLGDAPSGVLVVALAGASMAPAVTPLLAGAPATLAFLRGDAPRGDALVVTPTGTLVRFAQMIREATPETPGFLDAGGRPTWGILSNAIFGHTLRYYARRPVAADNFWDKFPSFERAAAFGDLGDEGEALTAAHELGARYLMTAAGGTRDVETINGRLQTEDGVARDGRPRLEHFRLVTEGPKGGSPLSDVVGARRPAHVLAYKLFEIVPGALLEVAAVPDTPVEAALRVLSPYGRSFVYRAEAVSGPDGVARLRVPYATRTALPTHPTGPWRVRAGAAEWSVDLDDGQIESGATIRVSR